MYFSNGTTVNGGEREYARRGGGVFRERTEALLGVGSTNALSRATRRIEGAGREESRAVDPFLFLPLAIRDGAAEAARVMLLGTLL